MADRDAALGGVRCSAERVRALRPFVPDFELVIDDVSHVSDDELARRLRRASVQLVLRVLRDGRAATDPAAWLLGVRRLIDEVRRAEKKLYRFRKPPYRTARSDRRE